MPSIRLPANGWRPRFYQRNVWKYLEAGGKRAICIWHRRAGKDDVCLHWAATAAMQRPGGYWHMLPEAAQARKAIWQAVNPHTGQRRIDEAFPKELRRRTNDQEMFIELVNGATWQVIGSDNYNSLVGSPPVGVVFSEWALADPAAWAYIRPILLENDGWALFITTPRGRNHAARFYYGSIDDQDWFAEKLSADDTDVFTEAQLDRERREYVREYGPDEGESRFRQEYYCDFQASVPGAFYGRMLNDAENEGRICPVDVDPDLKVHTAWDLGIKDDTAIWFFQVLRGELRIVDYYQNSGASLDHYLDVLENKGYRYGRHYVPHDAKPRSFASGRSAIEQAKSRGWTMTLVPQVGVENGIHAVRSILPRCWFDAHACHQGLEALREYRREWDDDHKVFKKNPLHNWASHAADSFRYLAVGYRDLPPQEEPEQPFKITTRSPTLNELLEEHDKRRGGERRI